MSSDTQNPSQRYAYIDALRGMAFLGVLSVHASIHAGMVPGMPLWVSGAFGVHLFFLVSALTLLISHEARRGRERQPLRNFFLRRFWRIAPLFWLAILLYLAWYGLLPRRSAPEGIGLWHIIATSAFVHGWHPSSVNSVVPGGWSIGVEMTFYLFVPVLAARLRRMRDAVLLVLITLALGLLLNWQVESWLLTIYPPEQHYLVQRFMMYWFPTQLCVFGMGAVLFFLLRRADLTDWLRQGRRATWLLIAALGALLPLAYTYRQPVLIHLVYGIVFTALALALALKPPRLFVNPALRMMGTISYSAYVFHFAALDVTDKLLSAAWFQPFGHPLGPLLHFAAVYVAALAITVPIAALSYRWIEQPGILTAKKIIARLERRQD